MKTAIKVDITFDQILSLVRQLPKKEKIRLTKELEREVIDSKLSELLKEFKTSELNMETITQEVEIARQARYERKKH
jgi:hypothetical protein